MIPLIVSALLGVHVSASSSSTCGKSEEGSDLCLLQVQSKINNEGIAAMHESSGKDDVHCDSTDGSVCLLQGGLLLKTSSSKLAPSSQFEMICSNADCCRQDASNQIMSMEGSKKKCESACLHRENCNFFSFSTQWFEGGYCQLCSGTACTFTHGGNGGYYETWAKAPLNAAECSTSAAATATSAAATATAFSFEFSFNGVSAYVASLIATYR